MSLKGVLSSYFQHIKEWVIPAAFRRLAPRADRPVVLRLVTRAKTFDFSHIDLWYERDAGERVGVYNLYRLKLRK